MTTVRLWTAFVAVAVVFGPIGCGKKDLATVTGTVSFRRPPTPGDEILLIFVGRTGEPITTKLGPDGTYRANDVAVGDVKIGVMCYPAAYQAAADAAVEKNAMPPPIEKYPNPVPKLYWDVRTSPVTTTTVVGPNTFDFQIAN